MVIDDDFDLLDSEEIKDRRADDEGPVTEIERACRVRHANRPVQVTISRDQQPVRVYGSKSAPLYDESGD